MIFMAGAWKINLPPWRTLRQGRSGGAQHRTGRVGAETDRGGQEAARVTCSTGC